MKFYFFFATFLSLNLFCNITFEELDYIRSLTNKDSESIISHGTDFCINYFDKTAAPQIANKYKNSFSCKFSKTRNRFYIYMLAVDNKNSSSLKEFCKEIIKSWPEISDHMEKKFVFQKKEYLSGFHVDNFFNNKVINFSNDLDKDQLTMNNEINEFILENRFNFSNDNVENNKLLRNQIEKMNRIYKKIVSNTETDLDKIIKSELNSIVRYKIFVNDLKNFQSYSCNWKPGMGVEPYVKREKFSEFENI